MRVFRRRSLLGFLALWSRRNYSTPNASAKYDTSKGKPFLNKSIVSATQWDRASIDYIFAVASKIRNRLQKERSLDILKGCILGNCFYEPSTRTSSSFQAAMLRLGGDVIPVYGSSSSHEKGETLEDTILVMESYVDAIVLRHSVVGSAATAANVAHIPIINAGDGQGEHPTQALLDLFAVLLERGQVDGLTYTMVGDLKYGRTVHSLSKLLTLFNDIKVRYVSTDNLRMPNYILNDLRENGITDIVETSDLQSVIAETDILYQTRIQKERFESEAAYLKDKGSYILTPSSIASAKSECMIMHPLPRVDEIEVAVDKDPRAFYFKQPYYGMVLRAALLTAVLGKEDLL